MADLFDGCRVQEANDEVFAEPGVPHEQSRALHAALQAMSAADLDGRSAALARAFRDQGITFSLSGEERPRGRDDADVTPLKDVYSGGGSPSLGVVVEVTRLR